MWSPSPKSMSRAPGMPILLPRCHPESKAGQCKRPCAFQCWGAALTAPEVMSELSAVGGFSVACCVNLAVSHLRLCGQNQAADVSAFARWKGGCLGEKCGVVAYRLGERLAGLCVGWPHSSKTSSIEDRGGPQAKC